MVVSAKVELAGRNSCFPCIKAKDIHAQELDEIKDAEKMADDRGYEVEKKKDVKKAKNGLSVANHRGNGVSASNKNKEPVKANGKEKTNKTLKQDASAPPQFELKNRGKMSLFFSFMQHFQISIYGISVMEQGLDYDKLLLQTDPLVEAFAREIELFPNGDQVEIAVRKAPDMTVPANRALVERIAQQFEQISYSNGAKSTSLWLREYIKYANLTGSFLNDDRESWVIGVYEWSQLFAFYKLWSQDFVWANTSDYDLLSLKSFRFRIGLNDLSTPTDLVMVSSELRELADKYPDLEIFTYQYSRPIADQLNVILQSTVQNDSLAVVCMIIISLIFIPNPLCAVWITIAIITIDIGVVGLLSLWSVKLDPIFMITIILSIGFSIEFSGKIFIFSKNTLE
ncbi:patched family protein [Oesophagostomum dentatum]|uniref:Patched family protein n=1 Tax=Oesophagostomum dentatum TaxID=61180 RepID=A0A0B1T1L1_OESDE|nr:patched family protein [Oesophagostomum dentatum]